MELHCNKSSVSFATHQRAYVRVACHDRLLPWRFASTCTLVARKLEGLSELIPGMYHAACELEA